MRILATLGLAMAVSTGAAAQGLKDYDRAPIWSGVYIGVHGGYGSGSWDGSQIYTDAHMMPIWYPAGGAFDDSAHKIKTKGGLGGGQLGFNVQSGAFVWGIEADGSWSGIKGDAVLFPFPDDPAKGTAYGTPAWGFDIENKWLATIRGRLGFAAGNMLLYGTGGVAFGGFDITHTVIGYDDPQGRTSRRSDTKVGWTVGAGAEWMLTPNLSFKAEYLYYKFSDVGGITSGWLPMYGPPTDGFKGDLDLHTGRVGLNYRF